MNWEWAASYARSAAHGGQPTIFTFNGPLTAGTAITAACPSCGASQIVRRNRYNQKWFTGCTSWPRCNWSKDGVEVHAVAKKIQLIGGAEKMKIEVGKFIKYQTNKGYVVGTVVGKNEHDNFILRVHKMSPVEGWKPTGDVLDTVRDSVENKYSRGVEKYTYWFLGPTDDVEEAKESDLSDGGPCEEATNKEEAKMSQKKNAVQIVKADAQEAAYRVAGKRLSQGAQQVVSKAVTKMVPSEHKETAEAIMQTEAGLMLTQMLLGWGLVYAPGVAQDPRLQKLATEFRVQATEKGMDMVVGGVLEHLQPVLNEALSMLPGVDATTGARVGTLETVSQDAKELEAEEEEAEVVSLGSKRQTAGK